MNTTLKRQVIAVLLVLSLSLIIIPKEAEGAWDRLELVPGTHTGTNVYIPGEVVEIVLYADAGDHYRVALLSPGSMVEEDLAADLTISNDDYSVVNYPVDNRTAGTYTLRIYEGPALNILVNETKLSKTLKVMH